MAKVITDDGSNHKPTKTTYGTNADGLPVPESMLTSKRSMIRCLFSSTEHVLRPVARLWARASNQALETVVSRAVAKARKSAGFPFRTDKSICIALGDRRTQKELPLLAIMGMVFPGSWPFSLVKGYVLFPSDSCELVGTSRQHPFGILAFHYFDRPDVHVFVDVTEMYWAAPGINEWLLRYTEKHPKFNLFAHVLYWGVYPQFDLKMETTWPLIVIPSILAYWRVGTRPFGYPDLVNFLDPKSTRIDEMMPLAACSNWSQWKTVCGEIQDRINSLRRKVSFAKLLKVVPWAAEVAKKRNARASRSKPFVKSTVAHYADLTGVMPYGQRGYAKALPTPKGVFQDPSTGFESQDYEGPTRLNFSGNVVGSDRTVFGIPKASSSVGAGPAREGSMDSYYLQELEKRVRRSAASAGDELDEADQEALMETLRRLSPD
ncbi:MAG: hypothetical protein IPP78_02160 [Holophagaceae bacterium]|nr:hypothetical protein [Holophagaceae bacterium]